MGQAVFSGKQERKRKGAVRPALHAVLLLDPRGVRREDPAPLRRAEARVVAAQPHRARVVDERRRRSVGPRLSRAAERCGARCGVGFGARRAGRRWWRCRSSRSSWDELCVFAPGAEAAVVAVAFIVREL